MINRIKSWWENRASAKTSSDPYLQELFGVRNSRAGVPVTMQSAEGISAVYACVGLISESVARLPVHVYRLDADGTRQRERGHYVEKILNGPPNERNTAFELKEALIQHLLLRGNGYCEILDNPAGDVTGLDLLHPDLINVEILRNGRLRYTYSDPWGGSRILNQDQVFHLRGRSDDGVLGKTPIRVARDTLGLALAGEQFNSKFFTESVNSNIAISYPKPLSPDGEKRFKRYLMDRQTGPESRSPLILTNEAKVTNLQMNAEDAQLVASRRFSFEEICRLWRVPPVLVGDLTNANYSNSQEMMRYFFTTCLSPHLRRFEEAASRCLLSGAERDVYFIEFESKALVQADLKTRFESYNLALDPEKGWMEKEEVRRAENLPPLKNRVA